MSRTSHHYFVPQQCTTCCTFYHCPLCPALQPMSLGRIQQHLDGLRHRIISILHQPQLDLDYFLYVINQEMLILTSASTVFDIPIEIINTLSDLQRKLQRSLAQEDFVAFVRQGCEGRGRPKFVFSGELLGFLTDMPLPVACIANILGVSEATIFRRMRELGLSTRSTYSGVSDEELDNLIMSIKRRLPTAGYRMVKGCLQAEGHRVQWSRVKESMHRVDAPGILERMTQLGCIVRRTYFVQGPLSLVHVDTNHKLIRYNIVIFGGIDGYSRKVLTLLLSPYTSTNYVPFVHCSRVRGDEGVENVKIAETIFIAGKSVHNQRIEHLWRDVWVSVTQIYYEVLHSLEEDCLLDISNTLHLFCVHYVFIKRLQNDLHTFSQGWDNHPLRTEGGLTPNQLWVLGHMQTPSTEAEENVQVVEIIVLLLN
uniref:Integrase core domain-containing protein n=1 Tax=Paramormyrops kingsleyae TaxID=1676925 RepID=A0A3B3T1B9_9TELE